MLNSKPGFTPQGLTVVFLAFILYQFGHNVLGIKGLEVISFILVSLIFSGFIEIKRLHDPQGFRVVFPKEIFAYEENKIRYSLEKLGSAGWNGLSIHCKDKENKKIKVSVNPSTNKGINEGVLGVFKRQERGIAESLNVNLIWKDCFGLVSRNLKINQSEKIIVYPQRVKIKIDDRQPLGFGLPFQIENGNTVDREGSSQDFLGIRKYVFGDSLKNIDRVSSEKTGELMVKKFHHLEGIGAWVRLSNKGWESYDHWENGIKITAAWASFWASKKYPVGFLYEGDEVIRIMPSDGESVLNKIFHSLALLPKDFSNQPFTPRKHAGNSLFVLPSKVKMPTQSFGILTPRQKIPTGSNVSISWKKKSQYWVPGL
ncbi:hypothetical protein CL645_05160 [bacterium]|nr:hypothetical protein [bacterium]|tara:strand:- start:1925 stop:3037 length:1113 start_codon:yes stop_codon:yes gene_type:complete